LHLNGNSINIVYTTQTLVKYTLHLLYMYNKTEYRT